jgi:hypothetical protein
MREHALRAVYDAIKYRLPYGVTFDQWIALFDDQSIHPIVDCGEIIGAAIVRKDEIHVGVKRKPRQCHRGMFRDILGGMLKNGPVKTTVMFDNVAGLMFCKRLGFEETHRDSMIHLVCKESRYV